MKQATQTIRPFALFALLAGMGLLLPACGGTPDQQRLPVLGLSEVSEAGDTTYHTLPDFALWDQDSNLVTQENVEGKIRVSDFFFTTCPTICPKMSQQMLRLHDALLEEQHVILLSHSIDPEHDSVAVLKRYADALGVKSTKWRLMTGDKDAIYDLAEQYLVSAGEDPNAPGGYIHSGAFIRVYPQRRVRGFYDGTDAEAVDRLLKDIYRLINEK